MQIRTQKYAEIAYPFRTQKYAKIAYPLVKGMYTNKDVRDYKKKRELEAEYRTQALNLPTMIMQSGLSQTVGFLLAKSKSDDENKTNGICKNIGAFGNIAKKRDWQQ